MSWIVIDPSALAMATSEKAGVGCIEVTAPEDKSVAKMVYTNFPVLTFQMSTLPSSLPTSILFKKVGMLQMPPDNLLRTLNPEDAVGVIVV